MEQRELEREIVRTLENYASLDFEALKAEVFRRVTYSHRTEQMLGPALEALKEQGRIGSGGRFGPFWVKPRAAKPRRQKYLFTRAPAGSSSGPKPASRST